MNVNIHPPDPDSLLLAENQHSQGSKCREQSKQPSGISWLCWAVGQPGNVDTGSLLGS